MCKDGAFEAYGNKYQIWSCGQSATKVILGTGVIWVIMRLALEVLERGVRWGVCMCVKYCKKFKLTFFVDKSLDFLFSGYSFSFFQW